MITRVVLFLIVSCKRLGEISLRFSLPELRDMVINLLKQLTPEEKYKRTELVVHLPILDRVESNCIKRIDYSKPPSKNSMP